VDHNAAMRRRNYALQRMAEDGYLTQEQADAATKRPIVVHGQPQPVRSVAPYFTEEVRKYLEQKYGAKTLYEAGLSVHTGVDIRLQLAANRAVDRGLRLVDKRRGYRRDKPNVVAMGRTVDTYRHERWSQAIAEGDIVPAVVTSVLPTAARVRIGRGRSSDRQVRGPAGAAGVVQGGDLIGSASPNWIDCPDRVGIPRAVALPKERWSRSTIAAARTAR
jgi:penicillin-binding protein 1A